MSETTQIVKVDPKEYGIEDSKAKEIELQFRPMLDKMVELEEEYNRVINLPIDEAGIQEAKSLRLKYVKVRTGTAEIHKQQKAFYLAAGRFIDGWKNTQLFASQGKEDALMDREKHFENLENERIEKLRVDRWNKLQPYTENEPQGLGQMDETIFTHFLNGAKSAHEAKIEAEKKAEAERLEAERIENLRIERDNELRPYYQFIPLSHPNFGELDESEWEDFFQEMKNAKEAFDTEQEKQRKENERLKAEAEAREKQRVEAEKVQREKEEKERQERQKERAEMEAKLKAEADAREAAEKKIRDQKAAEEKAEKQRIAEAKKAAKAPVKTKMQNAIKSLQMPILDGLSDAESVFYGELVSKHSSFKKWALEVIEQF